MRLDQTLVERKLVATRSRARDLILRGMVTIDGRVATKPAAVIAEGSTIRVDALAAGYVSRGAEKLVAGLERFGVAVEGCICLDVGSSTGGFTQVLLDRGAARVYAVDVGRAQLHDALRGDTRVVSLEETDARDLDSRLVPEPIDVVVTDLSFISLRKALGPALSLAAQGAWLIALVKPQFEAGREHIGKGGVVRDEAVRIGAVDDVAAWLGQIGWHVRGHTVSPIKGGDGNEEYLIGAVKP